MRWKEIVKEVLFFFSTRLSRDAENFKYTCSLYFISHVLSPKKEYTPNAYIALLFLPARPPCFQKFPTHPNYPSSDFTAQNLALAPLAYTAVLLGYGPCVPDANPVLARNPELAV